MLGSFLDRGKAGARSLSLPRVARGSNRRIGLRGALRILLSSFLLFQQVQTEVAQSIGAQTSALEVLVARYRGIVLEELRDAGEYVVGKSIDAERLEQ